MRCPVLLADQTTADDTDKILQNCRQNPQQRRVLFVEAQAQTQSSIGLIKMDENMMRLAAKMGGILRPQHGESTAAATPADNAENGGEFTPAIIVRYGGFWRTHSTIYLGAAQPLPPPNAPPPQLERTFADGLESVAIRVDAPNITRAFVVWGARHLWRRKLFTDSGGALFTYRTLFRAAWALGKVLHTAHPNEKRIGVMLPSSAGAAVVFYALLSRGYTPVMLNPLGGERNLISACHTAQVQSVYTARKVLKNAPLADKAAKELNNNGINTFCLEDVRPKVTTTIKLSAAIACLFPAFFISQLAGAQASGNDEAVVLFTSGSEGHPKGVVLSHHNLQINAAQVLARLGNLRGQKMFNALPVFHSFGLLAGIILPPVAGITVMHYPSPLHYRQIPDSIGRFRPQIFFSADSFLAQYGKQSHPLDLTSLQLVFAGAEKLKESTRRLWLDKFGVRIMEGYGVTEMSPAAAVNSATNNRPGTVGRGLSNIIFTLQKMPDMPKGGKLMARGPNVMLGYFYAEAPGQLVPPPNGVHDTGDIADIDEDGYIRIIGRVRRFIKVSGEMVPMDGVEEFFGERWPGFLYAVVSIADAARGEKLIVLTNNKTLSREQVAEAMRESGLPPFWTPRQLSIIDEVPQLPTGKINYPAAATIAKQMSADNQADNYANNQAGS